MVATWKTQAAPTFDAALRAAQEANDSMASGRERMSDAAGGVITDTGTSVTNRAKTELMNLDTDQARENYLTENPSSFYDPDALKTFRKEMLETDDKRKDEGDWLKVQEQTKMLSEFDNDPIKQAEILNGFSQDNAFNGVKDKDGVLKNRSDYLLNNETFKKKTYFLLLSLTDI